MSAEQTPAERLDELLVGRAVDGLDPPETAELESLLAEFGHDDPEGYDLAAAAVWVAREPAEEAMPASVAERSRRTLEAGAPAPREGGGNVRPLHSQPRPAAARRRGAAAGWVAAAAALVLAVAGWWPRLDERDPAELTAARDALLANASDAVRVDWSSTEHPRARQLGGGYVVWSDARQQGYMTFRDLPDNDPSEHVYQLWVFDAARSEQYPVDGGVFNAQRNAAGEVVIPIENKLPVKQATLFAVTLEPPGGVVVSDRDPILWVAKPQQATSS